MRNEDIKKYIDDLNNNNFQETIFLRKISKFVYVAKVWEEEPKLDDNTSIDIPSFNFFFIKNEDNNFIGAVLDMYNDLHWYIIEQERKKGYLTKSLREAIIPYIFMINEKEKQRISIEIGIGKVNYENSKRVADLVGFKPININETEFELKESEFDWQFEKLDQENGTLSKERFIRLRSRLLLAYRKLIKISDELLMTYNEDKGLIDIVRKIGYYNTKIEDIEWKYKKHNQN